MLTIREPIALKTQRPIQSVRQDMAERMQANYGLMRLPIRKEELLHITSEPPEIYFAEGDNLQIFTNIKHENQQEIRLDVINNLMNRIMVAQTDNFTYQDTVYISSVLRKLGIRDEKTFMKQVFQLQNAHKETYQLLKKYENNQEILQMLFQQEQEQRRAEGKVTEAPAASEEWYYIHDEIFKRLETGKIYQDMRSFTKGLRHESLQIFRNEFSVGEQARMVQNFHLHELKQKIMQMDTPLVYFHNNQYEFLQENLEEVHETLEERISAAILLNLTDQSYSLRQQQIEENHHNWYSVAGALFQTAENTWKRYEANLTENKRVSNHMTQVMEEISEVRKQEGDTIENIAQEFHTLNQDWQNKTELKQLILQQNRIQEEHREGINIAGGSYHLTQEELEMYHLQQTEDVEEKEQPAAVTAEQLQKQLEIFNQKNVENYQKLTEIEKQQPRVKERKLDRRRAQQDALRALENPSEVLMEFVTTEVHDPVMESQKQLETQIYELFSEETKGIYRQFLQQKPYQQTTFLQHIMAQPTESELRQEVVHAIEQLQQQELVERIEQRVMQKTETMQPRISQNISQEIRSQMVSLQELQNSVVYQQVSQPMEVRLRQQREKETLLLQQMEATEHIVTRQEQVLQQTAAELAGRDAGVIEKLTMIHPVDVTETEEIFTSAEEKMLLQQQEVQLTELRQTMEHQILKKEQDMLTESRERQHDLQVREAELIYETAEHVVAEELQERTTLQQQEEQLTELRQTMEHRIRMQETENLEETRERRHDLQMREAELIHETVEHVVTEELQEKAVLQKQEQQFMEMRRNIEKQIRRQEMEKVAELAATQREMQFRRVDIIHKTEEQLVTEELLETIQNHQRNIRKEEHREETMLHRDQINETMVQNTINRTQMNQIENIDELVQQTVRKQMNHISDQVYGKIEKKLATERKRRGY